MIDVEWVGQHSFNTVRTVNINTVDIGVGVPAAEPEPEPGEHDAGRRGAFERPDAAVSRLRRDQHAAVQRLAHVPLPAVVGQPALPRRRVVRLQRHVGPLRSRRSPARASSTPLTARTRSGPTRTRPNELFNTFIPNKHIFKGNFVWDLPDLKVSAAGAQSARPGHQRLAALRESGRRRPAASSTDPSGGAYNVGYSYSSGGGNVNITGSTDFGGARPHRRRPGERLQQRHVPPVQRGGVPGPADRTATASSRRHGYLRGCFQSAFDLTIARNIRMGGARNLQLRVDMFNAPNQAIITGAQHDDEPAARRIRSRSPTCRTTRAGNILPNRVRPSSSGFGQATGWQTPRNMQFQINSRSRLEAGTEGGGLPHAFEVTVEAEDSDLKIRGF